MTSLYTDIAQSGIITPNKQGVRTMEDKKVLGDMKFEKVFAWLYLIVGLTSIIGTSILWSQFDSGYIRYGIILPIFFFWQARRSYKKYKELKEYYDADTANKVNS